MDSRSWSSKAPTLVTSPVTYTLSARSTLITSKGWRTTSSAGLILSRRLAILISSVDTLPSGDLTAFGSGISPNSLRLVTLILRLALGWSPPIDDIISTSVRRPCKG